MRAFAGFGLASTAIVATLLIVIPSRTWAQAMPVFDAGNYAQNIIQAARALEQINNQIEALQNQATMLENEARNLKTLSFPQLQQMTASMQQIDGLMGKAQTINFQVDGLDQRVQSLFPGQLQHALTSDERVSNAQSRLNSAILAYQQSITVQAQVAQNVGEDARLLEKLSATSVHSQGALQAQQATNQLLALSVKQQLQLQNLMASEFREQALQRAREVQDEEDARMTTRQFLGELAPKN